MYAVALQSGSNGNCVYIETHGVRLLFDAGISGVQAEKRLAALGRDIRRVDAVIISHDHADHARCAGVFGRKYGLPIHVSRRTLQATGGLGSIERLCHFASGETLRFNGVSVETIRTAHDAADGVVFVVADGRHRVGVLTDLGHVFEGLPEVIASLDGAFIESNYDPEMLRKGPYPAHLQARIRGPRGHLSNTESADLLLHGRRLKWACLAHLSEENNTPQLALREHLMAMRGDYRLRAANRYGASETFEL